MTIAFIFMINIEIDATSVYDYLTFHSLITDVNNNDLLIIR